MISLPSQAQYRNSAHQLIVCRASLMIEAVHAVCQEEHGQGAGGTGDDQKGRIDAGKQQPESAQPQQSTQ